MPFYISQLDADMTGGEQVTDRRSRTGLVAPAGGRRRRFPFLRLAAAWGEGLTTGRLRGIAVQPARHPKMAAPSATKHLTADSLRVFDGSPHTHGRHP